MRDVNLNNWKITPHHTYFLHVQSGQNGESVGLSLVQIGDGSTPCIGLDSHLGDNYAGHVFVAGAKVRGGVEVQYFRDKQFIAETVTDGHGRHSLRMSPGLYQYRFLFAGEESREFEILVRPGHRVKWEDVNAEGLVIDAKERAVKFITEEIICHWDASDGAPFKWIDVVETICKIAERISEDGAQLRLCSFAQFPRPDIVEHLRERGVWAQETSWKDAQFAAAFRNLLAVAAARLIVFLRHDEANLQMTRNVQFDGATGASLPTRIIAPEGTQNFLALARAAAVYHASTLGGQIGNGLAIFDPLSDGSLGMSGRAATGIAGAMAQLGGENQCALPPGWNGRIVEQRHDPRA